MKRLLLKWVILGVAVYATSLITQALKIGFRAQAGSVSEVIVLLIGVAALALLNATMGKILKVLTFPISCMTLGLFGLVVNAIVLWFAATLELGFRITKSGVDGFVAAFVASVLISILNGVLQTALPDKKDD